MKRMITIIVLTTFVITLSGCATIFDGRIDTVKTSSNPSGAEVYLNGVKIGTTPVNIDLKKKGEYTILIKKEGYKDQIFKVTNKVGVGWIVLDVLMGFVPVIVDAVTGSWYVLNKKNFNAQLEKNSPYPCPIP
jgi:uncharacterized protein YceK